MLCFHGVAEICGTLGRCFRKPGASGQCVICLENLDPRLSNRIISNSELATNTSAFPPRIVPAANLIRNFLCLHLSCQENDQQDRKIETEPWAKAENPWCGDISLITDSLQVQLLTTPNTHWNFAPISSSCLPGYSERFVQFLEDSHIGRDCDIPQWTRPWRPNSKRWGFAHQGPMQCYSYRPHTWNQLDGDLNLESTISTWYKLRNVPEVFWAPSFFFKEMETSPTHGLERWLNKLEYGSQVTPGLALVKQETPLFHAWESLAKNL